MRKPRAVWRGFLLFLGCREIAANPTGLLEERPQPGALFAWPENHKGGVEVNWQELERHIQARTQAIWLTEPEDLVRLRNGVIDSGAGSYGQVFTTLLFAQSEVRGLAYYAATAILNLAQDPSFTLEQLKKMARTHFAYRAGFLNYVGLHELGDLYQKYFALLDGLPDREAFVRLTQAIKSYGARLHLWTEHVFPWGVGAHLKQQSVAEAKTVLDQVSRGPWKPVPYMTK